MIENAEHKAEEHVRCAPAPVCLVLTGSSRGLWFVVGGPFVLVHFQATKVMNRHLRLAGASSNVVPASDSFSGRGLAREIMFSAETLSRRLDDDPEDRGRWGRGRESWALLRSRHKRFGSSLDENAIFVGKRC